MPVKGMWMMRVMQGVSVAGVILALVQVVPCVMLFRERGVGTFLMLAGSIALFLVSAASLAVNVFFNQIMLDGGRSLTFTSTVMVAHFLSGVLFVTGLWLVALRRRATTQRVVELEIIIAELQARAAQASNT